MFVYFVNKYKYYQIILWGYPRNMRGNSFSNMISSLSEIETILPKEKQVNQKYFTDLLINLKGTCIGLSTLTKLLYFFNYRLDGYKCLILDRRILDVIKEQLYHELSPLCKMSKYNITTFYYCYIKLITELSIAEGYKEDQLELFLFQFGKNLKPALVSSQEGYLW